MLLTRNPRRSPRFARDKRVLSDYFSPIDDVRFAVPDEIFFAVADLLRLSAAPGAPSRFQDMLIDTDGVIVRLRTPC